MKIVYYICMCLTAAWVAACAPSSGNGQREMTVMREDSAVSTLPQRMQVSDVTERFTWNGRAYTSTVVRRPDDALPLVSNEQGECFVDNRITLRLTCEGKTLVDRVFTKNDFAALVNARFMKYAILEGLVFDQTTAGGVVYAASVCYPQSDLYVPIRIVVRGNGAVTLEKADLMEDLYDTDSIPR